MTDKIRKTVMLSDHVDMALRLRSANSRKNASLIIEEALSQFLGIGESTNLAADQVNHSFKANT
jgi:hypothetical protein